MAKRIPIENKTYFAAQKIICRHKQQHNHDACHHPEEKTAQIKSELQGMSGLKILELFAGHGNMTRVFKKYGGVESYDKLLKTGDSFVVFHGLIAQKKTFDVIDVDPYGFPNRLLPDVFLLMKKGKIFFTMPKPYVNILNGITAQHLICYYGKQNPSLEEIIEKLKLFGLCHWRKLTLTSCLDLKSVWRLCFDVERVKATEYCGVRNRPVKSKKKLKKK